MENSLIDTVERVAPTHSSWLHRTLGVATILAVACPFTALIACAGSPPPTDRMASSEAAIRGAEELGAPNIPQAELHLKLAQEQTAQAKTLMKNGDNDSAALVLERARADAELAIAMAKEDAAHKDADQAESRLKSLSSKSQ
jgi:hypothetical protein